MTVLMAIGGAMDLAHPAILHEFVRRAGGAGARIVILPQASALSDTGAFYVQKFLELGVTHPPVALDFRARTQSDDPAYLAAVREASGIFFTGGTQMRIAAVLGGTRLEAELLAAFRRGALVGGTSAGAAILSRVMLAYGRGGPTPRERIAQFTPGLGFTDRVLFDQHFRQRDRFGRLAYAVAAHPGLLGVGVDENTAAILENDRLLRVLGRNAVTIVDGQPVTATNIAEMSASRPVAVSGLGVHVLTEGCSFDLETRTADIPQFFLQE